MYSVHDCSHVRWACVSRLCYFQCSTCRYVVQNLTVPSTTNLMPAFKRCLWSTNPIGWSACFPDGVQQVFVRPKPCCRRGCRNQHVDPTLLRGSTYAYHSSVKRHDIKESLLEAGILSRLRVERRHIKMLQKGIMFRRRRR